METEKTSSIALLETAQFNPWKNLDVQSALVITLLPQ